MASAEGNPLCSRDKLEERYLGYVMRCIVFGVVDESRCRYLSETWNDCPA